MFIKHQKVRQKLFRYVAILFQIRRGAASRRYVQKSGQNHRSYVWTEALSDMVFGPVQDLSTLSSQPIKIGIDKNR